MNCLLNLKEEVINKRTGLYKIRLEDKEKLENQLKKLRDDYLFEQNNITYTYTEEDKYISLMLYKPIIL